MTVVLSRRSARVGVFCCTYGMSCQVRHCGPCGLDGQVTVLAPVEAPRHSSYLRCCPWPDASCLHLLLDLPLSPGQPSIVRFQQMDTCASILADESGHCIGEVDRVHVVCRTGRRVEYLRPGPVRRIPAP